MGLCKLAVVSKLSSDSKPEPEGPMDALPPLPAELPLPRFAGLAMQETQHTTPWQICLIPSRGSKNHASGQCRPCWKYPTPGGCLHGEMCNFCHGPHDAVKTVDATLYSTRKRLRRLQRRLQRAPEPEPPPAQNLAKCMDPRGWTCMIAPR
mmetsp:Transcript_10724/g.20796  ORF Transcript_10724/g.20796 Transcript_10724/m.20796 type:complete len:151 (-) Transcript_10724:247-699(-)